MKNASTTLPVSVLGAIGLYALVASCSTTMESSQMTSELRALSGDWIVVKATPQAVEGQAVEGRHLRVEGRNVVLQSGCDFGELHAVMDRRGHLLAKPGPATCDADGDMMAFMSESPKLVRINAKTAELRRGRHRLRIRKA